MTYPLPGKISTDERTDRKTTLIAFAVLIVLGGGVWLWLYPGHGRAKTERAFLWTVAYSDDRITSHVGRVKDVHVVQEKSPSGRRSRDAHHRRREDAVVIGSIKFLVLGESGAARAEIAYRWNHESGEHSVTDITLTSISSTKQPNKALEPTSTSVMPPATSRVFELKHRTESPREARVMPAVAVAHL